MDSGNINTRQKCPGPALKWRGTGYGETSSSIERAGEQRLSEAMVYGSLARTQGTRAVPIRVSRRRQRLDLEDGSRRESSMPDGYGERADNINVCLRCV